MRDSVVVLMFFSSSRLGWQMAVRVVSGLDSKQEEPAAGAGCGWMTLSYDRIRSLRFDLDTHPQHAAATAAATQGAGVVRGECHLLNLVVANASTGTSIEPGARGVKLCYVGRSQECQRARRWKRTEGYLRENRRFRIESDGRGIVLPHRQQMLGAPCPDFLWRLVALIHRMRLSLTKGAHAELSSTAWQEIGVAPIFCGGLWR